MLFSNAIPTDALATFCRMSRHGLSAGLSLVDVINQQAKRGPVVLRPMLERMVVRLKDGDSLEDAIEAEGDSLPDLFKSMAAVGEHTGHMPEVLGELERYYTLQGRLRKQFLSEITWPVIQFVLAVLVIAGLIFILGLIGQGSGTKPIDPLGLGLTGPSGAILFLGIVVGSLAAVVFGYKMLSAMTHKKPMVDRFFLRVPALGPCLEAIALGRFSLALRLTLGAGLPVKHALKQSLNATGNSAFQATSDTVTGLIRKGDELHTALEATGVFPQEFLDIIANAEEGGRIPEVMEKQAEFYAEEASRRMTMLTKTSAFLVWALIAILIIIAIFKVASIYFNALNSVAG